MAEGHSGPGSPVRMIDPIERLWGKKVHLITFGCLANRVDTERLRTILAGRGCTMVAEDEADAIVVNTCTVVARTERQVIRTLMRYRNRELYVMGCMPAVQMSRIATVCSPVVILPEDLSRHASSPGVRIRDAIGAIRIAEGCSGSCSYCIARLARGPLRSYSGREILRAIRRLADEGVLEIQLTAQDVASWGAERGESLPDLMKEALSMEGDYRIRLGMMNPASLKVQLEEWLPLLDYERLFRFIHLPLQAGSDRILSAMRREYTAGEFVELARSLRAAAPDLFLATDVIVGYPGETEEEFHETLRVLREVHPSKVNITRYSHRPGTEAGTLRDMPDRFKKDRSRALHALAEEIYHRNNRSLLGATLPAAAVEVLVPGTVVFRTPSYRSVVVRTDTPPGTQARVRITGERMHYFTGELAGP